MTFVISSQFSERNRKMSQFPVLRLRWTRHHPAALSLRCATFMRDEYDLISRSVILKLNGITSAYQVTFFVVSLVSSLNPLSLHHKLFHIIFILLLWRIEKSLKKRKKGIHITQIAYECKQRKHHWNCYIPSFDKDISSINNAIFLNLLCVTQTGW